MESGIYIITNLTNNKRYVGSSRKVARRLRDHRWMLNKNIHSNPHLQASYNQHGAVAFHFVKIEECTVDQLHIKEQEWINKLDTTNPDKGYNIKAPVEAPTATYFTEHNHHKSSQVGRHIDIYNKETLELLHTLTINAAETTTGVPKNKIWDVIAGRRASAKGFIFRRRGEPKPTQIKVGGYKAAREVSIDGTTYPSVQKAAELLGVKPGSIYDWIGKGSHNAHYTPTGINTLLTPNFIPHRV